MKRQLREAERALAEALAEAQALRKQAEEEAGAAGADRDGKLLEVRPTWPMSREVRVTVRGEVDEPSCVFGGVFAGVDAEQGAACPGRGDGGKTRHSLIKLTSKNYVLFGLWQYLRG